MVADDFPLTVPFLGVNTPVLIDINGTGTLNDDGTVLSGSLVATVLAAETNQELISDSCTLMATRN